MQRGLEPWRSLSGRFHFSWYLADFANALVRADQKVECERVVAEAEDLVSETGEGSHIGELKRLRGLLWYGSGNKDTSIACMQESLAWSVERQTKLFELRTARVLLRISTGTENEEAAKARLRQVVSSFPPSPGLPELVEACGLIP
jgi:hypothetical protein